MKYTYGIEHSYMVSYVIIKSRQALNRIFSLIYYTTEYLNSYVYSHGDYTSIGQEIY